MSGIVEVEVGQVWASKRDNWRRVTITGVHDDYVNVRRNTSRRTQAISRATLARTYVLVAGAS